MSHATSTDYSSDQGSTGSDTSELTQVPPKTDTWTPAGEPPIRGGIDELQSKFSRDPALYSGTLREVVQDLQSKNIEVPDWASAAQMDPSAKPSTFDSSNFDPTPVRRAPPRAIRPGDKPPPPRNSGDKGEPSKSHSSREKGKWPEMEETDQRAEHEYIPRDTLTQMRDALKDWEKERREMRKGMAENREAQANMAKILSELALATQQLQGRMKTNKSTSCRRSPTPDAERRSTAPVFAQPPPRTSQEVKVEKFAGKDEGPSWEAWLQSIKGKLRINSDHFNDEEARMLCVFTHTKEKAQEYLLPRYADEADDRFTRAEDMLEYLATVFGNAFKQRDAIAEVNRVKQGEWETFATFQGRFIKLVQEARVPIDADLTTRLYDKLTSTLRMQALSRYSPGTPYQTFVENVQFVDAEMRRVTQEVRRYAQRPSTSALTSKPTAALSPTPVPAPVRQFRFATHQPAGAFAARPPTPDFRRSPTKSRLDQVEKRCFGCSKTGHMFKDCPTPRKLQVAELEQLEYMLENAEVEDPEEDNTGEPSENYRP